jgi:DNA-binding SARP family transcriptional activator
LEGPTLFRILGPVRLERGGQALEFHAAKAKAVAAMLLLRAGRVVPADALIDAIWGEASADGPQGPAGPSGNYAG